MNTELVKQAIISSIDVIEKSNVNQPDNECDIAVRIAIGGVESIGIGATMIGSILGKVNPLVPVAFMGGSLLMNHLLFSDNEDKSSDDEIDYT